MVLNGGFGTSGVTVPGTTELVGFARQEIVYDIIRDLPIPVAARLRRGSLASRLLGLRVRIPPAAWMSVSCECCVLSVKGLCDGPITRPEESYRVWCV